MTRGPVSAACVTAGASASQTIARAHRAILTLYPTLLPGRSAWQCTDENGLLYRGEMAERSGRVGELRTDVPSTRRFILSTSTLSYAVYALRPGRHRAAQCAEWEVARVGPGALRERVEDGRAATLELDGI